MARVICIIIAVARRGPLLKPSINGEDQAQNSSGEIRRSLNQPVREEVQLLRFPDYYIL
jgi:hypothetical protein